MTADKPPVHCEGHQNYYCSIEDIIMRNLDLSPLYRSFIGLDHLANMMDSATRAEKQPSYPPYNVELLAEDKYRITMAVAGFVEDELKFTKELYKEENIKVLPGSFLGRNGIGKNYIRIALVEDSTKTREVLTRLNNFITRYKAK